MNGFRYIAFFILSVISGNIFAQATQVASIDTLIWNRYPGVLRFSYQKTPEDSVLHGKITFISQLIRNYDKKEFSKLTFNGNFQHGLRHGTWAFSESLLNVRIEDIVESREFGLEYDLNGKEVKVFMHFKNGKADGQWTLHRSEIIKRRRSNRKTGGVMEFRNGNLIGEVFYENEDDGTSMKLALDQEGLLHGQSKFTYQKNNQSYTEVRNYEHGFLIKIEIYHAQEKLPFKTIVYSDIIEQLNFIGTQPPSDENRLTISSARFGIQFNNGYRETDAKLTAQLDGNAIFDEFYGIFTQFLVGDSVTFSLPKIGLTKRIQFDFTQEDQETLSLTKSEAGLLRKELDSLTKNPRLILYAERSDSLKLALQTFKTLKQKTDVICRELTRFDDGYFLYQSRDNFYKNGIVELSQPDTVRITSTSGKKLQRKLDLPLIKSSEDILNQLYQLTTEIQLLTESYGAMARDQYTLYVKQDDVDRIDETILRYQQYNDSVFSKLTDKKDIQFNTLSLKEKMYLIYQKNQIKQLKESYLNAKTFDDKIALGNDLICFIGLFSDKETQFEQLHERYFKTDSLFTLFVEHPFDDRLFESAILGNIKEKGLNQLYTSYVEELFRTSKCKDVSVLFSKIENLFVRLEELAKRHNDEDVIRLNRYIRRENIPMRIERMLDLEQ